MPFHLGYSTNVYTRFTLEEAIDDIARAGFDGVEILADAPHLFPPEWDGPRLATLLKRIEEAGLAVANLNVNTSKGLDRDGRDPEGFWPSLIDPDPAARRLKVDYVRRALDAARALGAPSIAIATGKLPPGMEPARAFDLLSESLRAILDHADRVDVGIEYEPGFFVGDARSLLEVLLRVRHSRLGANLDIGHAVCAGDDPAATIRALGGKIRHIHIEDIRARVHEHLIPGDGGIDFGAVRTALEGVGYARFVTAELYPYKDDPGGAGRRARAHLRACGF